MNVKYGNGEEVEGCYDVTIPYDVAVVGTKPYAATVDTAKRHFVTPLLNCPTEGKITIRLTAEQYREAISSGNVTNGKANDAIVLIVNCKDSEDNEILSEKFTFKLSYPKVVLE